MSESVQYRIINHVAAATDTDPLNLPPLYETVDADALETVITEIETGKVVFSYADQEVTVESDRTVRVNGQSSSNSAN